MTVEIVKMLEERISVLDFKLELVLKLTKNDMNMTLEDCKTMIEFAFVTSLNKDEFVFINRLLTTQINFYQSANQKSYVSSRQYPKLEQDIDVFIALSKDEYESELTKHVPKLSNIKGAFEKLAKINGITEMYYGELATEIRKTKNEKLDKEAKLFNLYNQNKDMVDNLYNDINLMNQELQLNFEKVNSIIKFFQENELVKISDFYNGELWDKSNDDKRVVVNEESYIHNVCKTENKNVLDTVTEILKDKKVEYKDLIIHLLKSSPTNSKKIESLQDFYKLMEDYNKKEYVQLDELISLKDKIQATVIIVDEISNTYQEYVNSL